MAKHRVAVDVGGTFTDLFVYDEEAQAISIVKTPSTPRNQTEGVMDALKKSEVSLPQMVFFSHGSTVGTNALITRRLPRTGLVTTRGYRDIIEIRRGTRPDLWDAYADVAPPYIPRRDRLTVEERIDYSGKVLTPLNEEEARRVARILKKRDVQSVAICFVNAYMNGEHEAVMKKIILDEMPDAFVSTSYEVLPELLEHERTSTTVINACLGPVVSRYLQNLEESLRQEGYKGDVLVIHSGGGVMTANAISEYAARIACSGPTGGAAAMAYFGKICGYDNAIGLDMGGTSADISLMYAGDLRRTKEWFVEYGYPIMFPSVEVLTIGAGGGSVAWIDEGGSLRNGPQSMGADPGPACYLKGGSEPTNADANLVLGRLNADMFLGGTMQVDPKASEKAIKEKIADRLGMTVAEAASAVIKVANANMADAVRLISIRRGYDPREFALVVFGGAGPVHGAHVAQDLGIPTVIVPPWPGVTSAMGCLLMDVRHDLSKTYLVEAAKADIADMEKEFQKLEREILERLSAEGVAAEKMQILRYVDMRYLGQWRSLTVPATRPLGDSFAQSLDQFHKDHQREYAFSQTEQPVEVYGLRVTGIGLVGKPELPRYEALGRAEDALKGERPVYFEEASGFTTTKVYDRGKLAPQMSFDGPAIVEQLDSTVVVPPGVRAEVDAYRNIILRIR